MSYSSELQDDCRRQRMSLSTGALTLNWIWWQTDTKIIWEGETDACVRECLRVCPCMYVWRNSSASGTVFLLDNSKPHDLCPVSTLSFNAVSSEAFSVAKQRERLKRTSQVKSSRFIYIILLNIKNYKFASRCFTISTALNSLYPQTSIQTKKTNELSSRTNRTQMSCVQNSL